MRKLLLNSVAPWFVVLSAGVVFMAMITSKARGEELNFALVGKPESRSTSGMSFQMVGTPVSIPQPMSPEPSPPDTTEVAKPTVYAYKDFAIVCPACLRLQQNAAKLPFKLEWKQAPKWVKSYPTLHWQGVDGEWYQYRWGTSENDYLKAAELYAGTMEPQPEETQAPVFQTPLYYRNWRGVARWTWPGNLRTHLTQSPHNYTAEFIASKSDRELINLHDQSHGGVKASAAPVRRYCPTCPN